MYSIPNWPTDEPAWTNETYKLLFREQLKEPPNLGLHDIIKETKKFPIRFPVDTVLSGTLKNDVPEDILKRNINSAYPLLHEQVLLLCAKFLLLKRNNGSELERKFYANMSVLQLVQRLLQKRAVVFVRRCDQYLLLNGRRGIGQWETIGTDSERKGLTIKECLSYDELKLSPFLSVSSYTYFVNDGNRLNKGKLNRNRENIEDEGIIIGLIGTRVEKQNIMEYADILITPTQNIKELGFGKEARESIHSLIAAFYEKPNYLYKDVKKSDANFARMDGTYFDNATYAKRIALSLDTLFVEANERAKNANTTSFVHVVGIGLGVWKVFDHQHDLFLQTAAKRLELLGKYLHNVSDVFFDYFPDGSTCGKYEHGDIIPISDHPKTGIKVHIGKRDPHEKLSGEHKGKLLVVSYAWDGNALPGNEFWYGKLHTSSDPAAASSTQVAELHNPHINPKVSSHNLRVVTPQGVLTLKEYKEKLKQKYSFNF